MAIDRELYGALRRLDRHDLRRVLIFVRGLLQGLGDEQADLGAETGVTFRLESVSCGKLRCTKCPHGPYWYAYYREDGRLRSRYIGRELPEDVKRVTTHTD